MNVCRQFFPVVKKHIDSSTYRIHLSAVWTFATSAPVVRATDVVRRINPDAMKPDHHNVFAIQATHKYERRSGTPRVDLPDTTIQHPHQR